MRCECSDNEQIGERLFMVEDKSELVRRDVLLGQLTWLQRTLLYMNWDTDVKDLLSDIARTATQVTGANFCVVQPYDQQSDKFLIEQFTWVGDESLTNF